MKSKKLFLPIAGLIFFASFSPKCFQNNEGDPILQRAVDRYSDIINSYNRLVYDAVRLEDQITDARKSFADSVQMQGEIENSILQYLNAISKKGFSKASSSLHDQLQSHYDSRGRLVSYNQQAEYAIPALDKTRSLTLQRISELSAAHKKAVDSLRTVVASSEGLLRFSFNKVNYRAFVFDRHKQKLAIINNDSKAPLSFDAVIQTIKSPLMLTNAGMFSADYTPVGLMVENFNVKKPIDTLNVKKEGNFYLYPNGVFWVDSTQQCFVTTTANFLKQQMNPVQYATQSGPMLVIDGNIHRKFNAASPNQNIRSGVGIFGADKCIFLISDQPVNFFDFAIVFKDILQCNNALYLDGSISKMYSETTGKETGGQFGPIISITKK